VVREHGGTLFQQIFWSWNGAPANIVGQRWNANTEPFQQITSYALVDPRTVYFLAQIAPKRRIWHQKSLKNFRGLHPILPPQPFPKIKIYHYTPAHMWLLYWKYWTDLAGILQRLLFAYPALCYKGGILGISESMVTLFLCSPAFELPCNNKLILWLIVPNSEHTFFSIASVVKLSAKFEPLQDYHIERPPSFGCSAICCVLHLNCSSWGLSSPFNFSLCLIYHLKYLLSLSVLQQD